MSNICPVCGYPDLDELAYLRESGNGSQEICASCGFQYGFTDLSEHITFEQWRERWIAAGMPWAIDEIEKPPNWNPSKQLLNVGVKI